MNSEFPPSPRQDLRKGNRDKIIRKKYRFIKRYPSIESNDQFIKKLLEGYEETWEKDRFLSQISYLKAYLPLPNVPFKWECVKYICERFVHRVENELLQ